MTYLISTMQQNFGIAYAQAQGASGSPLGSLGSLVPIVLMIGIFYFLLIRPQQKREKERKSMIAAIKKGDKVLTSGGMYATVDSVKDSEIVVLKISGNTKAEFTKNAIQSKVS